MIKCPICTRQFKTRAALKQHTLDSHSGPSLPVVSVPRVLARTPRRSRAGASMPSASGDVSFVLRRCEFLTKVGWTGQAKESSGYDAFSLDDSNSCPVLMKLAKPFEMYKIHSMAFVFKTASATTRSGQVVMGVDYAPTTISSITKQVVLGMQNKVFPCYEKEVRMPLQLDSMPRFRIPKDNRDKPFVAYWYASSSDAAAYVGDIYLDYHVTLYGIQAGA
jgi:hypothetical protein